MPVTLPPLSLYVHLPWCVRKCPYCDFNSHERAGKLPEEAYLAALLADLEGELADIQGRRISSIFFGGGTPSLLSAPFYQQFLDQLRSRDLLSADCEITLEANPGTLEQGRFEGYRAAGINRLSIGVQSFNATHLEKLGRIHGRDEALRAARAARAAGFDNFNLDLMHGLPGQTPEQALTDLKMAIDLEPTHLSWYELTIEPNTVFWSRPPQQPDEDTMADIEESGFALLARAGFARYEVSAFSQPGQPCRHNLNYWQFGDYLGIGAGAHGKITRPDNNRILRYRKTRKPEDYLAEGGSARRGEQDIHGGSRISEFMLNALRLVEGVPANSLEAYTGIRPEQVAETLAESRRLGLLRDDPDRLVCTPRGLTHLNRTLELWLALEDQAAISVMSTT